MSLPSPTPYRDTLTRNQQGIYRQIVSGILEKRPEISVRNPWTLQEDFPAVLRCIHYDHPELFWINWWSGIRIVQTQAPMKTKILITSLLDPSMISACNRTLRNKLSMVSAGFPEDSPMDAQYKYILRECICGINYKDTGSAFWDHTIMGPLLSHTAVCEGISKLFLLYCQHFSLPCIIVAGKHNDVPHAWNVVMVNHEPCHIDVTAVMQQEKMNGQCLSPYKTLIQQIKLGYRWEDGIPSDYSGR